ncbi:hypothetical protein H8D36_01750 [archaeon]|nr:hypothetical protein [archaeon]MBL7057403.1 hypothetical protein [Candidatus Woesearchaeota archaeon]
MISFACKNISLKDLVTCSFELNKTDYSVFMFLMEHDGEFGVGDIAGIDGLERSTVQKAMKNLVSKNLVSRRQVNFSGGGYQFYYSILDKSKIKDRINTLIDGWHEKAREQIQKWDQYSSK